MAGTLGSARFLIYFCHFLRFLGGNRASRKKLQLHGTILLISSPWCDGGTPWRISLLLTPPGQRDTKSGRNDTVLLIFAIYYLVRLSGDLRGVRRTNRVRIVRFRFGAPGRTEPNQNITKCEWSKLPSSTIIGCMWMTWSGRASRALAI